MKYLRATISEESKDKYSITPYLELEGCGVTGNLLLGKIKIEIPNDGFKPVFEALMKYDENVRTFVSDLLQNAFWAGIKHENKRMRDQPDAETAMLLQMGD